MTETGKNRFNPLKIYREQQNVIDCFSVSSRGFFRTLIRLYRGNYKNLFISTALFLIKNVPTWLIPIITANIINVATERPENSIALFVINAVIILLSLIQNVFTHTACITYFSRAQRSVEAGLRGAMVRRLQQLSVAFHKETESGKIQSKVMRDVESVENFTNQIFNTGLNVASNLTIALFVVISKSITVFIMFLLCIPFAVSLLTFFRKKMRNCSHDFRKNMENTASDVLTMEELIPVTRAHALEHFEMRKMVQSVTRVAESGYKMDKTFAVFGSINWVIFAFFQMVCLFFSGYMAYIGEIGIGDIALFQSYFGSITGQVSSIIALLPIISKGKESLNSIGEILAVDDIEQYANKKHLDNLEGSYEFKNVSFNYDSRTAVLRGLDLTVKAGETIALVGESGSGKSTIINLVIGFNKPDSGKVLIDGNDINDIDMRSCRRFISVVPQNTVLFNGTVRENITYGCRHISDEVLYDAVKAAGLESVLKLLPDGIDTLIGEHGAKLSGGQRQRISIARSIIRNPKVIIFDEATSALDSVTEREIQEAIDNLTRDRTTFIVAHRLSTIINADKIAVIEKGRCVEFGTYDELMAQKGAFYKLKMLQA